MSQSISLEAVRRLRDAWENAHTIICSTLDDAMAGRSLPRLLLEEERPTPGSWDRACYHLVRALDGVADYQPFDQMPLGCWLCAGMFYTSPEGKDRPQTFGPDNPSMLGINLRGVGDRAADEDTIRRCIVAPILEHAAETRAFLDNVERLAVPSPKTQRTRIADGQSQKVTSRIVELRDKGSSKLSYGSIAKKVNSEMGKRLDKELTAGAVRQRYEAHKKKATRGTGSSRDV